MADELIKSFESCLDSSESNDVTFLDRALAIDRTDGWSKAFEAVASGYLTNIEASNIRIESSTDILEEQSCNLLQ